MKLHSATIRCFKGIEHLDLRFSESSTKEPRRVTALFGDNASGKTSVLQAIALVLSLATRKTPSVDQFRWHGFLADRIGTLGETHIELEISLDQAEVQTVHELFELWRATRPPGEDIRPLVPPGRDTVIRLIYENGRVRAVGGRAKAVELYGRYYVKTLTRSNPTVRRYFTHVGDVFWFDQYRNLGTGSIRETEDAQPGLTWEAGVAGLRDYLIRWWTYHVGKPDSEYDFLARLEQHFSRIFRGTSFDGVEPMQTHVGAGGPEFYFMLRRGDHRYDISEMSSGEQAVFSVLYEFVRLSIAKSIVLIDELELHLHPPEQQALYNALEQLGTDNQYIITSHSPYLDAVIPDDHKVRLKGGRLCL